MASFLSVKSKRKDLEEVYDDFSDFSLSSPARKIRRLDAELPPIMEEEEHMIPPVFEQPMPEEQPRAFVVLEEMPPPPSNEEERALVVYKPVNAPYLQSPTTSGLSFKVLTELIPDQMFWSGWSGHPEVIKDAENEERETSKRCLAVVPWTPSNIPTGQAIEDPASTNTISERMEAEAGEATSMEVEDENNSFFVQGRAGGSTGGAETVMVLDRTENPQQQWQQHCMAAQLPPNTTTPVMWSW
ncbi:uncharacterized protein [Aristolochia californica]|uniref:uncharacterized protein isoform X2 n=1 Tax=Aristolochia californica TaxID=171875 RepID=UPI0035DAA3AE